MLQNIECASTRALITDQRWNFLSPDSNFDCAIFFLTARLTADAGAIINAAQADQIILLRRITIYAQAIAVIPARGGSAIEAKLHAAHWSLDQGAYSLRLTSELADELMASAGKDKADADVRQS